MLPGFSLALSTAPSQVASMGAVDKARSRLAAGAISTLHYLGGAAGIAVLGEVLAKGGAAATLEQHLAAMAAFGGALAVSALETLALSRRDAAGREPAKR